MNFDFPVRHVLCTEIMPLLFAENEAREKLNKTIITCNELGTIPPGTVGTIIGMTQSGQDFLLDVRWHFPEPASTGVIDKEHYEKQFELPSTPENTVEAMYLSLDLQRHFKDDELRTLSDRLKTISKAPTELDGILRQYPAMNTRLGVLSLACELAAALDRDTERHWTERMTDTLARDLTLSEIAEMYFEFSTEDKHLGLAAESRIVKNACNEILRSHRAS